MSSLIERQAAIDALCAVCGNDCDKSEFVYNAPQDEQVILCPEHYCLCTLPSAQQWISCEERLPEEEKAYLVTFACEKVGMSSWHKDTLYNRGFDAYMTGVTEDGECEYFGVVAWMEKPEPWKGEKHVTSRSV